MIKDRFLQLIQLLISSSSSWEHLASELLFKNSLAFLFPEVSSVCLYCFSMTLGLVKVDWVKPGATLFIRYMILLFVPISVGLMQHFDMLLANALPIIASAVGGSLIVLVSLAWLLTTC